MAKLDVFQQLYIKVMNNKAVMPTGFHGIREIIDRDSFENTAMIQESTIFQFLDYCQLHQIGSSLIILKHLQLDGEA